MDCNENDFEHENEMLNWTNRDALLSEQSISDLFGSMVYAIAALLLMKRSFIYKKH
jgi:hypothetical protein